MTIVQFFTGNKEKFLLFLNENIFNCYRDALYRRASTEASKRPPSSILAAMLCTRANDKQLNVLFRAIQAIIDGKFDTFHLVSIKYTQSMQLNTVNKELRKSFDKSCTSTNELSYLGMVLKNTLFFSRYTGCFSCFFQARSRKTQRLSLAAIYRYNKHVRSICRQ